MFSAVVVLFTELYDDTSQYLPKNSWLF